MIFEVAGRIDLFEANEIDGNTTYAPASQSFTGGTILGSFADPLSGITGEIGFVRIGGNATNFSVTTNNTDLERLTCTSAARPTTSTISPPAARVTSTSARVRRTSTILTHSIENLYANRDANLNSTIVTTSEPPDRRQHGLRRRCVQHDDPLRLQSRNLATAASTEVADAIPGRPAGPPTSPRRHHASDGPCRRATAQANGMITAFIAGNVTNSVFAASDSTDLADPRRLDQPESSASPATRSCPLGGSSRRVEGAIDNSTATPNIAQARRSTPKTVSSPTARSSRPTSSKSRSMPTIPTTPIPGIPRVFPANASQDDHVDQGRSATITNRSSGSGAVGLASSIWPTTSNQSPRPRA